MDPKFSNSELEWSTKRRGVAVLVGLLVKVEGVDQETDTGDSGAGSWYGTSSTTGCVYTIYINQAIIFFICNEFVLWTRV